MISERKLFSIFNNEKEDNLSFENSKYSKSYAIIEL